MPNWCCTNYCIRGKKDELEEFARTLNTMENHSRGFDRFWLGNILIHFGMTYEEVEKGDIHCRGTFDPNFYARARLCGPDVDRKKEFSVDDDGLLRLSTVSAYFRCGQLEEIIKEHFPSLEFFWTETDEFGNFHDLHDPEDIAKFPHFIINDEEGTHEYGRDGFSSFIGRLRDDTPGLDIPEDADAGTLRSEEFFRKYDKWSRRTGKHIHFIIYSTF